MFDTATAAVDTLREAVGSLEPRTFRGDDAARLLKLFAEAKRLAAAGQGDDGPAGGGDPSVAV